MYLSVSMWASTRPPPYATNCEQWHTGNTREDGPHTLVLVLVRQDFARVCESVTVADVGGAKEKDQSWVGRCWNRWAHIGWG